MNDYQKQATPIFECHIDDDAITDSGGTDRVVEGVTVTVTVRWSVGPLVHWSIGPLVHWSIGQLVRWSVGTLVH